MTEIRDEAFAGLSSVLSIDIPASIKVLNTSELFKFRFLVVQYSIAIHSSTNFIHLTEFGKGGVPRLFITVQIASTFVPEFYP